MEASFVYFHMFHKFQLLKWQCLKLMDTLSTPATNNWAGLDKFDPGQVKIIIDYIRREIF